MKKRKICYFLIFFVFSYLFILFSPVGNIGLYNYVYSYVLVDKVIRNAPFKEYASGYSHYQFDRFTEGRSEIYYCKIPLSEIESVRNGLKSYLMTSLEVKRAPAESYDSEDLYRYRSVENEKKSFIINVYESKGVKCVSLSEDTEPTFID